ncbi:GTP cyclohydrolase II [Geranomyces variabilis]|nr:GTP cyclohydrolase II [Geranomyces variabilis]
MVPLAPHLLAQEQYQQQLTEQGSPIILPATVSSSRTPSPFFADHRYNHHPKRPASASSISSSSPLGPSSTNAATDAVNGTAAGSAATVSAVSPLQPLAASTATTTTTTFPQQPIIPPQNPPAIPLAVRCQVRTRIPSEFGGECHVHLYSNTWDNEEHLALVFGDDIASRSLEEAWAGDTERERMLRGVKGVAVAETHAVNGNGVAHNEEEEEAEEHGQSDSSGHADAEDADADVDAAPLVRIHSCCFTGETLRSLRCDCAEQLEEAMRCMAKANRGVVLYLKQEGRGIGLRDKLRAYNLIDLGHDTMAANLLLGHPPDARSYEIASAMLRDLGIARVRLLTNNPDKMRHLERDGVVVTERVPMVPASWRRMGLATTAVAATEPLPLSSLSLENSDADEGENDEEAAVLSEDGVYDEGHHDRDGQAVPSPAKATNGKLKSSSSSRRGTPPPPAPPRAPARGSSPRSASSASSSTTTSVTALRLQDRDEYLVTKVQRMGHILDIPQQLLEAVNK